MMPRLPPTIASCLVYGIAAFSTGFLLMLDSNRFHVASEPAMESVTTMLSMKVQVAPQVKALPGLFSIQTRPFQWLSRVSTQPRYSSMIRCRPALLAAHASPTQTALRSWKPVVGKV